MMCPGNKHLFDFVVPTTLTRNVTAEGSGRPLLSSFQDPRERRLGHIDAASLMIKLTKLSLSRGRILVHNSADLA